MEGTLILALPCHQMKGFEKWKMKKVVKKTIKIGEFKI